MNKNYAKMIEILEAFAGATASGDLDEVFTEYIEEIERILAEEKKPCNS